MNRRLVMQTLGCSKNTVDSEHIAAALKEAYDVDYFEDSYTVKGRIDVFLINTCSFIADAKQESVDAVLEACALKNDGICSQVVVFGCLGERYASQMPDLIPEVDAWFGARDFQPLLDFLGVHSHLSQRERLLSTPSHYAYLKISEGCDRRCSYCAIPLIRGAHRSIPVEDLVQEAECLAARGVKELIIIAQDSTYYGLDIYKKRSLAYLLHSLSEVKGIQWIRIHYSYPASFPQDVLQEMASNPKICNYIDIPLQHISTEVLARMHRGVDSEQTKALVAKMRNSVNPLVLRTTMIVGHPGETQEDFDQLLDFIREARFERLGAFTYSEEEDTYSAIHYRDDVPLEVKQQRYDALMSLQQEISFDFNRSRIGSVEDVIIDSFQDGILVGRSRYESPDVDGEILIKYDPALCSVPGDRLVGEFIKVKIEGADSYDLIASIVSC